MSNTDYYDLLGINKNASDAEIKSAYRKMAMKYHPDRNQGDKQAEEKFKEINKAYEVLKDPQKKAAYDQYGSSAFENNMGGAGGFNSSGGFDFNFTGGGFSDIFSDIFSDFMGGGRSATKSGKGQDLRYDMSITLEEAFNGIKKNISFRRNGKCKHCSGSGGDKVSTCSNCRGSGFVNIRHGFFINQQVCPDCNGTGRKVQNPCSYCNGTGIEVESKNLEVQIPSGVDNGTKLRISGEGEAGFAGSSSGDLFIYIMIKPNKVFTREDRNLFLNVPISFGEAALGGTIEVPVIEGGKVEVNIPKGTQTGERLRLRGKGFSILGSSSRGDMYLDIVVETPTKLTANQEELLKQFEEDRKKNSDSKSFFDKIKDWL